MATDVVITIGAADVDGMARQIAEHDGFEDSDLPTLRDAVANWFERIVEDTVTDRGFAMKAFGYRWEQCLDSAQAKARQ